MPKQFTEQEVIERIEDMRRRRPRFVDERITMSHGSGGKASRQLVEGLIVPALDNPTLASLGDAAVFAAGAPGDATPRIAGATGLAFTTDAFVVQPIRFPGGSIGELAVNGTVNDLAMVGARPLWLSAALILEEGLDAQVLAAEVEAMAAAARGAGVAIVAGDTKVVQRGKADMLYITTTGIGALAPGVAVAPERVQVGDKVLVSGTIGDHGVAIMLARGELDIDADVRSDTQPLWPLADALLDACGAALHCMRDATRGGVATVLNEIALATRLGVVIDEQRLPLRPAVVGAGEILGIDPLYVANEGKLIAFVAPEFADAALQALRSHPAGADAAIIGEVRDEPEGRVLGRTTFGGHRMIDMLVGDPLPRIC